MDSSFFTFFLPLTLAVMMMGLGLQLTPKDFIRVNQFPKVIFLTLFSQLVILPVLAFLICLFLELPPLLAIGLMLLAASPGGPTANLFSYVYKGDVALNITLTAMNSVMATFTLPFIVNLSFLYFMTDQQQIGLPIEKMAQVFLLIIVPVCVGMAVRNAMPQIATHLGKPMRLMSIYFIFALFFYALFRERANVLDYFSAIGIATALFCFLSLLIGYLVPYLSGVPDQQARSCCFEIGIHNTAVSLTIALSVLQSTEIAIPSAIYTIFMYMLSFMLGNMMARQSAKHSLALEQGQKFSHKKNAV